MADMPTCSKCGVPHWRFKPCEQQHAKALPLFVHRRPREGFREFGDRLDPSTVRVGNTTFGTRRQAGEQHGALRPFNPER